MASSQTRAKRGKSFSKVEDETLCIAWLCISEDPAIGVGQKDCNFWNRIFNNFMNNTSGEEQRTLCSLQNRWDKIRLCCNKYRGCLAQIQNHRQSGTTQADNVTQAKVMYHNDTKKPFIFYHCWAILKDTDKWWISELPKEPIPQPPDASQIPGPSISLDSDHDPSPGTGSINSPQSKNKRPIGRKAEKASRRKSNVSEQNSGDFLNLLDEFNQQARDSGEKKFSLVERKLNIEERKIRCIESAEEREQMIHENEIMKIDTSNMDPQMQRYYQLRKDEIMAKVLARSSSSQFYIPSPPDL